MKFKIGDIVIWNSTRSDHIGCIVDIKWNHDEYEYYIHWFKLNKTRKHPKHCFKKVEEE
jgi:hypothetical protein